MLKYMISVLKTSTLHYKNEVKTIYIFLFCIYDVMVLFVTKSRSWSADGGYAGLGLLVTFIVTSLVVFDKTYSTITYKTTHNQDIVLRQDKIVDRKFATENVSLANTTKNTTK